MSVTAVSLASIPLFSGLEPRHLELLAVLARPVQFNAGDFIFRVGEPANTLYLLKYGRVALELHAAGRGTLTIQTLNEGELLGLSWVNPPYTWNWDARAVTLVRALAIDAKPLLAALDADQEMGYRLMRRVVEALSGRLHATRVQLMDIYGTHR